MRTSRRDSIPALGAAGSGSASVASFDLLSVVHVQQAVVPEPATVALLAGGLAVLGVAVRRRGVAG